MVILDVPDPSTSQINRFYTAEFFGEVRRVLTADGVLSLSLGRVRRLPRRRPGPHVGHRASDAAAGFANVLVMPGGRIFFLASDGELTGDVAGRIEAAGVPRDGCNRRISTPCWRRSRMADLRRAVSAHDAPVNRDFNPILYYYHLRYWMSQFKVRFGLLEAALLVGLAVYVRADSAAVAGGVRHGLRRLGPGGGAAGRLSDPVRQLVSPGRPDHDDVHARPGNRVVADEPQRWPAGGRRDAGLAAGGPGGLCGRSAGGPGGAGAGVAVAAAPIAAMAVPLLTLLLAVLVGMVFPLAAKLDFRAHGDAREKRGRAGCTLADYLGAAPGGAVGQHAA